VKRASGGVSAECVQPDLDIIDFNVSTSFKIIQTDLNRVPEALQLFLVGLKQRQSLLNNLCVALEFTRANLFIHERREGV